MILSKLSILASLIFANFALSGIVHAESGDGIVRVRSAVSVTESVERIKKDVAAKGIMFFSEIDQQKLAADAGIKLNPSTLLVFGNPPLGTQFITANANAGLNWPVRLLVTQNEKGEVWAVYRLPVDRRAARDQEPRRAVQDGNVGGGVDHLDAQDEIARGENGHRCAGSAPTLVLQLAP